jgi:hypothetical protein
LHRHGACVTFPAHLNHESGYHLWLAVIEDLEILFFEASHYAAPFVADNYRHQHLIHVAFKGVSAVLSWNVLLLRRRARRGNARQAA